MNPATKRIALAAITWIAASAALANESSNAVDGWDFAMSDKALVAQCEKTITDARVAFATLENDRQQATLERVYGAFDNMNIDLQKIQHIWYLKSVDPDPSVQAAAEECVSQYSDFSVTVDLSEKFYHRVAAIKLDEATAAERLMVEKRLLMFRKAGVDRDEAIRSKVRKLSNEITKLGSQYDKNIRTDTRYVEANAAALVGLPQDFLDAHPADEKGVIRISTDYPDFLPVMTYSTDDDLRRRLFIASKNIATPGNDKTLKALISKRHELATLLDYDSYAAMAMDGLMAESPQTVQRFLAQISVALKEPAGAEMARFLAHQKQLDPGATEVQAWQVMYLSNVIRQEDYALDARKIREYFHFNQVQSGIFALTEDLFGVEIVRWKTATWHPDVTAWEMRENGKAIGRFYLDMHPRENKYNHAAHWTLRTGLVNRQLPLSGMATNFPQGLMEHRQVETFLHEFGHLLHNMFSGTQRWLDISGMSMERDFVEAPSQMLQEWAWDYETLRSFAINDKGQPIPRELVATMNRARKFGEATKTAAQIFYANLSLNYYQQDPGRYQLLPLLKNLQREYSPFPYVPDTYFYNNFGHLNGYSSNYYIYQWSEAISTDFLRRFHSEGLRNVKTSAAFRNKVLAPAGSKPARQLVEDFLGRPFSAQAYISYLQKLN